MNSVDFELPDSPPLPRKVRIEPPAKIDFAALEEERRRDEQSRASKPVPGQITPLLRTLPHSVECEQDLLSCCLIEEDEGNTVRRCLEKHIAPESFYIAAHGIIFERLTLMLAEKKPIAVNVLAEELKAAKQLESIGGYAFLTQITERQPSTLQAAYFIDRVSEQALLRETIRHAIGAVEEAHNFTGNIEEFIASVSERMKKIAQGRNGIGEALPLSTFLYPNQADPNILLGDDDYLGRGGGMTLISYAGAGKSSLIMQACQNWALARPFFGIKPNGRLKSVIIQGEDSARYLGKVAGSFLATNPLSVEEKGFLDANVLVYEAKGIQGAAFLALVDRIVQKEKPDLVIINPVYLYVEGDINTAQDVKPFLLGLDAINAEKKFGWILVHHTGKPAQKDNKGHRGELENWETIYMGLGSSFWANWPRASAMLEPRGSAADGRHYWLKLGKGWQNAGVIREENVGGEKHVVASNRVALKYSDKVIDVEGGKRPLIYWEYDQEGMDEYAAKVETARDNGKKGGRPAKFDFAFIRPTLNVLCPSEDKPANFNVLYRAACEAGHISKGAFTGLITAAVESGELLRKEGTGYYLNQGPIFAKEKAHPSDEEGAPDMPPERWDLKNEG